MNVLNDVFLERQRQNEKWGKQHHSMPVWNCILGEEVGEVSQAILNLEVSDGDADEQIRLIKLAREELVQVAAVAVQIVEFVDEMIE